jgi:hypothetical protein
VGSLELVDGRNIFFLSTIAQYILLSSISHIFPKMRFPEDIPPSIPTAPHAQYLKSCICLLSIVSEHFLHCIACLVWVYLTPPYTMEGMLLYYIHKMCLC